MIGKKYIIVSHHRKPYKRRNTDEDVPEKNPVSKDGGGDDYCAACKLNLLYWADGFCRGKGGDCRSAGLRSGGIQYRNRCHRGVGAGL